MGFLRFLIKVIDVVFVESEQAQFCLNSRSALIKDVILSLHFSFGTFCSKENTLI